MSTPLDRIAAEANREIKIRVDSESSTLEGEERAAAGDAVKRIIARYQETLKARGGFENVLQEMRAYLAAKIGDPLSLTDPTHRQELDPYRTALRGLLDPEPPTALFRNRLHPEALPYLIEYAVDTPQIELKELLAYYWLAASDPNMPLSKAQLATVPGDILKGMGEDEKRNILIEGEKKNLIVQVAEIRRAHNGDPFYKSKDSMIDEPSCGQGTFGRIISSPLYNPTGKLQVNPAAGFKLNIEAFIFKKFQEAGKEVIDGYQAHVEKHLIGDEPEETPELITIYKKYEDFIKEIVNLKEASLTELETEYGDAFTPERREIAKTLYEGIAKGLNLIDSPSQTLVNRMNEVVERQQKKVEILKIVTGDIKPQYIEHYNKISEEMNVLTQQLMSYDFENATSLELPTNKNAIIEKYNALLSEKELGNFKIIEKYQNLYKEKLQEAKLRLLPHENLKIGLAELDDNREHRSRLDEIRSVFDSKYTQYLEKEKVERDKRIEKAFSKFSKNNFIKDLTFVNIEMYNELLHMQQAIDDLSENLAASDLKMYEKNISQHSEKIENLYKNARDDFLKMLYKEGLTPSPEELDTINQKLQKSLNIKQKKEQLAQMQSKFDELKKVRSVYDNYQELLQTAKYETCKVALSLYNKVNDHLLELIATKPEENSPEGQQLEALKLARKQLKENIQDAGNHKELEISKVIEKADNLKKIVTDMQKKFDEIGYPGKLKSFTDGTKKHVTKLLNWMFKLQIKTKKSVEKNDIQEILSITKLFDISKIKNASEKIEKPKYATSNNNARLKK